MWERRAVRMFVAVVPPATAVSALEAFLAGRAAEPSVRWAPPAQWHLTLAFLGSVPPDRLPDLRARLLRAAARRSPVALRLAGGGAFPRPARPRVIWTGVEVSWPPGVQRSDHDAAVELSRLATGTRAAARKAGIEVDDQRFRAHLTVGRVRTQADATTWLRDATAFRSPSWVLDEIVLVESHLGSGPARHEIHDRFPIG